MAKRQVSSKTQKPAKQLPRRTGRDAVDDVLEAEGNSVAEGEGAPLESGSTALAAYSSTPTFDTSDVFIPNLRLAQGLTAEVQSGDAKPGEWLVTGFEPVDEVTIVPMLFGKGRELRDPDDRSLLCRSQDSIIGVGNPGGVCADCPLGKWTEKRDGTRVPPECNFMYRYVVYSQDHESLATLTFQKTALRAGKVLNTAVAKAGLGNVAVVLKAEGKKGPKGTFYSPAVVPIKAEKELLAEARTALQEMV